MASISVTFDSFPDGPSITSDTIIAKDAFSKKDILLYGAPNPMWCEKATKAAVRLPSGRIRSNYLTTCTSDNVAHCNTVPIAIEFRRPVSNITLIFHGTTQTYTLNVYDNAKKLIGKRNQLAVANGGAYDVTYSSETTNIKLAIFGCSPAIGPTSITEIRFSK